MNNSHGSEKRIQINKTNTRMFVALGVAAAIFSFTVVTSIKLLQRLTYQSKVITERSRVEKQLKANIKSVDELVDSYRAFDQAAESVIGTSDNNSKIVLDALPSKYDFPALATSLEKMLISGGFTNIAISGSDNEASAEQNSASPTPVEIPFTISAKGTYENIQKLIANLQLSIRPFKVQSFDMSGKQSEMNFTLTGTTYYQPEKNLEIPLREVK